MGRTPRARFSGARQAWPGFAVALLWPCRVSAEDLHNAAPRLPLLKGRLSHFRRTRHPSGMGLGPPSSAVAKSSAPGAADEEEEEEDSGMPYSSRAVPRGYVEVDRILASRSAPLARLDLPPLSAASGAAPLQPLARTPGSGSPAPQPRLPCTTGGRPVASVRAL